MEDNTKVKIGLILVVYSAVSVFISMFSGGGSEGIQIIGMILLLTSFFSGFFGLLLLYKGLPKIGQGIMLIGFGVFFTIISLLIVFAVNTETDMIVAFSLMVILLWTLALFIPGALLVGNVDISRGFQAVSAFFASTIFWTIFFITIFALMTQFSLRDAFYGVIWLSLFIGIILSLGTTIIAFYLWPGNKKNIF